MIGGSDAKRSWKSEDAGESFNDTAFLLVRPGVSKTRSFFTHAGFTMANRERKSSPETVFLAFFGGAIGGMIAGILLAPKSGEETRRVLKGHAQRTEEEIIEKAKEARAALDEFIERGKDFVEEKRADVESAVRAGREAVKERVEKHSS
jgi:gas vesicle protein